MLRECVRTDILIIIYKHMFLPKETGYDSSGTYC
jgi:hypothetical protein